MITTPLHARLRRTSPGTAGVPPATAQWRAGRPRPRGCQAVVGCCRTIAFFLGVVACFTARADIEFIGILATSHSTQFALSDTSTGRTGWVGRGEPFAGYTVTSYDSKTDTLTLHRDGVALQVRLKDDAKVKAARLELTGSISFSATDTMQVERATLLLDQENVFPLKDGITYRITPERRPDGTIVYRTSIERVLGPNKTERLSAPAVITLPGQQFSMRVDDLGFSFKPL